MPSNKSALLRYKIIDKRIRSKFRPFPGIEDLRQACEDELFNSIHERISVSTIEKDLKAMREDEVLGYLAPIVYDKYRKGYMYSDPSYSINDLPLNDQELNAIRFASQTLFQFRDTPLFRDYQSAIQKIFSRVEISARSGKASDTLIQFEKEPVKNQAGFIPVLMEALIRSIPVEITYRKFGERKNAGYTLHPLLLKEYRSRWYVVAQLPEQDTILVYALDRITSVQLLNGKFRRPPSFKPDAYFKNSLGITVYNHDKPQIVVLSFTPAQGNYLQTKPLHGSQKVLINSSREFRLQLKVQVTWELMNTILGYGDQVKVISPQPLVGAVCSILRKNLDQYKKIKRK